MKIQFPNQMRETSNDIQALTGHEKAAGTQQAKGAFKVDISSKDKDINAFGMEDLMSATDVMDKASVRNISLEQNALAVMSNSMSGEDFAKLQKDGFSPDDMNTEETVTSLDKIKAKLVQSGTIIPGYTDDLSPEQIAEITGSMASAAVIESALRDNQLPVSKENVQAIDDVITLSQSVTSLSNDAAKYMITNNMEPSVSNLYMASHSSSDRDNVGQVRYYKDAAGYVGKNATSADVAELKPQIEKIITEAGLSVNEESLNAAQWLIERNIPLTADNIVKLNDINSLTFPLDIETVARSSSAAIADGHKAKEASLVEDESIVNKAGRVINETLKALDQIEKNISSESEISKRRLVEEIRLHMTVEANLQLIKKGIKIDTTDLEKLVEDLKQAERESFAPFLMEEDYENVPSDQIKKYEDELTLKIDLFRQTTEAVANIKSAPADIVSELLGSGDSDDNEAVTLSELSNKANVLKADYDKAGKSYETMMTAPRADMGDSIRKAFRNVDDILEDLNLEVNRLNEKAVRILGYAGIEINESNINTAAKAEVAVENIIANMTPARTLKMIRDGENPLDTDVYELADKLMNEDDEAASEKYAEFLVRLEKSGEISPSEKKSFIGMYRLFRKIEKSDGKLIGDVIRSDANLTFNNIIAASRSDRQLGTDIKVDDAFGSLEKLVTYGESITDQILAAFKNSGEHIINSSESIASELSEKLDSNPATISDITSSVPNTNAIANADKAVTHDAYAAVKMNEIRQAVNVEESVLSILDNVSEAHSPVNMAAADMLMNSRGSLFKTVKERISGDEEADFASAVNEFHEGFYNSNNEGEVKEAYKNFVEKTSEIIKDATENADTYIDVRSMKLAAKQLTFISKMANERTYEVPVEIDGQLTSINLKLICDSSDSGKISVSYETDNTGKVKAEFTLRNGEVSGFIVTENSYFDSIIGKKAAEVEAEITSAGIKVSSMYHTSSRGLSINGNYTEKGDASTPETSQLYSVAKAIIKAVQK